MLDRHVDCPRGWPRWAARGQSPDTALSGVRVKVGAMPDVEVTQDGAVLTITLNRPDVLNALNASVHAGILAALRRTEDPSVRAVLITGAGRGFCVGQDLQEFRAG